MELCASVLAANHAHIARDVAAVERLGIRRFHFDVCDGYYAPNLIFGPQLITDLRRESPAYFDAHLAVLNIPPVLDLFLYSGADLINIQFETCQNPLAAIENIHAHGLAAGLCLRLATDMGSVAPFLPFVEHLNLLAVEPGIGGQAMNLVVLNRIDMAKNAILRTGARTLVSVDGGVNLSNIRQVREAGVDIAILGSGIFVGDVEGNVIALQERIQ